MSKTNYSILIAICAIGVISTGAWAKGGGKKAKAATPQAVPSDVYTKYDANANGSLCDVEKAKIKKDYEAEKSWTLKMYDTDSDGKLSDTEIAAIPTTKAADVPEKKKRGKKNK